MADPLPGQIEDGYRFNGGSAADPNAWTKLPAVGAVEDGYRFKGGDPASRNSWEVAPSSDGTTLARGVGLGVLGFNDAVAGALGGPVDIAAYGLRQLGVNADKPLLGSGNFRDIFDYTATLPRRIFDVGARGGDAGPLTESRTARDVPRNDIEKIAYGAGKGVGGAASFFLPAGVVSKLAPANTATQGVARQLAAQPVAQTALGGLGGAVTETTGDPWLGAGASLLAGGGGSLARRALTPAGEQYLNEEQRRLLQVLTDAGVPTTAAQASGSPFMRTVESGMKFNPLTSAVANADAQTQRAAFNRAVTTATGEATDSVTPQWLQGTKERLGRGFEDVAARNTIGLDNQLAADMATVTSEYGRNLNALQRPIFDRIVREIEARGVVMPGADYQKLRSTLGRLASGTSDTEYGNALAGLQKALDDAATRSLSPADAALWQQLRGQYGAYKTVQDAMRTGSGTAGDIAPVQLHIAARDRNSQQLRDLAMAGREFVRDTIPNSGTAQRLTTQAAVSGAPFFAVEPTMALGAFFAPPVIQAAMRSGPGRAYLTNNLMGGVESPLSSRLALGTFAQRELQDRQAPAKRR